MVSSSPNNDQLWPMRVGLLLLCVAALGNVLGIWNFHQLVQHLPVVCPIRTLTRHDCPGCGMGRALALLTQGQLSASLHQHPFALPFLVWVACWALLPQPLLAVISRTWPMRSNAAPAAAVVLLIVWWLVTKVI